MMVLTLLPMTALAEDTVPDEGKEVTAPEEGTVEEMPEDAQAGPYRITFDSNGNGTVGLETYGNGELTFDAGTSLQAVAFPEEGFHLEDLSITDSEGNVLEDAAMPAQNLRFIMPEEDITVKAVFAEDSYEGTGWRQQAAQERFYLGKEGSLIGKRYQGESAAMLAAMLEDGTIEDGRDFFSLTIFKNYTVSDVLGFTETYGMDIDGLSALADEGGYSFFREFVTGRKLLKSSGPMNITKVSLYEDIWYGGWFEGSKFTITGPSGTYTAYCTQHDKLALPTDTAITYTYENTNVNMAKLLYYGLYGLGYDSSIYDAVYDYYGVWDTNLNFIYTARLMSDFRSPGSAGLDWDPAFTGLKDAVLAKPAPPAGFKTYIAGTGNDSLQELIFGTLVEGKLSFTKSANPSTCGYSLQGAVYRVYKGTSTAGTHLGWFITDAAGTGYVVERINGSDLASAASTEDDGMFLKGIKTKGGKSYDFGRYSGGKDYIYCKTSATEMKLDGGSYFLEEYLTPSNGKFYINTTGKGVTVTAGKTTNAADTDVPKMDPVGILLTKKPVEGTGTVPSLEDAQFTLKFYEDVVATSAEDMEEKTPTRTWVYKTNNQGILRINREELKVSGDELYYDNNGSVSLPQGTVIINETLAPEGYFVNENTYFITLVIPDQPTSLADIHYYEQEKGSDTWTDLGTQMVDVTQESDLEANIDELLTPTIATEAIDNLTGTHVGVAGKNDSITDTVMITNAFPGKEYTLKAELIDKDTKEVLATVTKDTKAPNSSDTYIDYEVTMPAMRFNASALKGKTVVVYETMSYKGSTEILAEHADLFDADQSIFYPGVGTEAIDGATQMHSGVIGEDAAIIDSVKCTNLAKDQEYILKGKLVYKNDFTDENGTSHKAGDEVAVLDGSETTKTFTAKGLAEETVKLTYYVDSTLLAGASVVVFEDLYVDDVLVASHADLTDEGQTIGYPALATTLIDEETESKHAYADEDITLVDTVTYKNLIVGETYTISGILMDKETGEAVLDDDGEEITSEAVDFTPEESDGTLEITFSFKGVTLAGKAVVAFEDLYVDDVLLASHADLEDEDQTVYIPKIGTSLKTEKEDDEMLAATEITLIDTVSYENLIPRTTYKMSGMLMDKETGEALLVDGEEVTAEAEFTPEEADGTVEITFTFPGESLAGKTLVAFEELTEVDVDVIIADHTDINDEEQTVTIPEIGTTLVGSEGEKYVVVVNTDITLVDTVAYKNLRTDGREYTVTGILMDKDTEEAVLDDEGEIITAEASFVPESATGTVEVTFVFKGYSLARKDIVAFELLNNEEGNLVAMHADLEDEAQTVQIPGIGTQLMDKNNGTHIFNANEKIELTDTIEYNNFELGYTYTFTGFLFDVSGDEPVPVLDKDGKLVTASTTFEPEEEDGEVTVEFAFENKELKGSILVCFEYVTVGDEPLEDVPEEDTPIYAEHTDPEDTEQQVRAEKNPETGDQNYLLLWELMIFLFLGIMGGFSFSHIKSSNNL